MNLSENWIYPDKKEFVEWVNEKFLKYRATGKAPIIKKNGIFTPFNYQKLLRDYMQNSSPYRGVLLYHGLGSGKTCTAISISENLKTNRNIVVMLPASLKSNFIQDGLLFCGDPLYKTDPNLYKDKYSFVSYNANNTVAQINKIGNLDNKVIIIEEVHNLISKMVSGICGVSKQGLDIYNYLMNAQNAKIIALSGTPIINDPFECAVLFNILRGYIEITYFRIIRVPAIFGQSSNFDELEKELMSNKYVDYVEFNKINMSIEFHLKIKNYSDIYRDVVDELEKICQNHGLKVKFLDNKKLPLFPIDDDGAVFRDYFVKEDLEKGNRLKNEDIFKRRILGLVSYYKSNDGNYPKIISKDFYRINMSRYQFQMYELLRAKERLSERGGGGGAGESKKGKKVKSTFRVFSRQACNFVFPENVNRPYPDPTFIVSLKKKNNEKGNKSTNENENENQNQNIFSKFDKNPKKNKKAKLINFSKQEKIEENLNNNIGKFPIDYKNRIESALLNLTENGEKYFSPSGLDILSPKMKIMLENINNSKGLVFVYSNFRTLEGIEIFSKVLDFNGYSRFSINNEDYNSESKKNIEKQKPKYAIYSGLEDEKEKNKFLSIFKSYENRNGNLLKILMATSAGAEGLDLKNIRQIHIMEPYWNQMRIEQVIGRGVRRNSHIDLPEKERNVEVFRYFSVFDSKNALLTKDKLSTDEYIDKLSLKKQFIINEVINILKICAFDCVLNSANIKGSYDCFSFGKESKGIAFYPTISKDMIEFFNPQKKQKIEITYTKALINKKDKRIYLFELISDKPKVIKYYLYHDKRKDDIKIDVKEAGPIYVDKKTNIIYDYKSVVAGNPKMLGYVNKDNIFSKNRKE